MRPFSELCSSISLDDALAALERMRGLRVAVLGETIIDEYVYCDAIGKSGKEPMLVSRFISSEAQGGGAVAVANHISEFCESIELVTALGAHDTREDFVRSTLNPRVQAHFMYKADSPTIVKRRYLDAYSLAKMMGVYHYNPAALCPSDETALIESLTAVLARSDVLIVADYGHGLITPRVIEAAVGAARFLAVNTQMNAANHGYHTLSRYPRLDYACLHEGELRLDCRDLHSDLRELVERTSERLDARALTITRGKQGTVHFRPGGDYFECPALAAQVVERVGAGDAVFALTSLAVAGDCQPDLVGLLGNLAGAQQVAVVGNSAYVQKEKLVERLRELLSKRSSLRRAVGS